MKDLLSSFDSKQQNNTVEEILNTFKEKSEAGQSRVQIV